MSQVGVQSHKNIQKAALKNYYHNVNEIFHDIPFAVRKENQFLQVLDIIETWICHILNFSVHQNQPALTASYRRSIMMIPNIYVQIVDYFYLIIHSIRRLDLS